jgi:hypothetical protein
MTEDRAAHVSRRTLFRAAALGAGVASAGGGLLSLMSPAAAALPTTLPIAGSKKPFFKNVESVNPNARMQSFAFDSVNNKMFTATPFNGKSGDLEIRRILVGSDTAGNVSSEKMIVPGAGHGVSFGVEPIGGQSYIWLEYAADSNGYGTKLARFRFVAGRNTASQSLSDDLFRYSGSRQISCSVDHVYNYGDGFARLGILLSRSDDVLNGKNDPTTRLEVYKLKGLGSLPELEWAAPVDALKVNGDSKKIQGWTLYANRYYAITGDAGADNTHIHLQTPEEPKTADWHTAKKMWAITPVKQNIASTNIVDCEPEGLGVYRPDSSEVVRLNFGLTAGGTPRKNSVYFYKSA